MPDNEWWSNRPSTSEPLTRESLQRALDEFEARSEKIVMEPHTRLCSQEEYQHVKEHGCATDPLCWAGLQSGLSREDFNEAFRRIFEGFLDDDA